jgi:hypothetical protein
VDALEHEQAHRSRSLTAIGLEKGQHLVVRTAPGAGEAVRDEVRKVVVADDDLISITQREERDLRRRPRSHPREALEHAPALVGRRLLERLQARRTSAESPDGLGAPTLDAEGMPRVVRQVREQLRSGRES